MTLLQEYISELNKQFYTGLAREHTYRPALQHLLSKVLPDKTVVNEPARISCGAPDYIITRTEDNAPVAFVEAKDIGDKDLDGRKQHKEQFERYKKAFVRIAFTDYLDFHLYENGEWVENVRLGEIRENKIYPINEAYNKFESLIKRFACSLPQKITSATKLAKLMASKAKLLASTIKEVLDNEDNTYASQQLQGQYSAFAKVLLHDITHDEFADIYAQTIAYGMFAARMHDKTPEDFSRQEAATLIPKTNPFLRQVFQSIAGYDLDERIAWIVDDLALTFVATDMSKILKGYKSNSRHSDPMIHFYEDFLTEYNPKLRKAMGVWYTPAPVVGFIVRSVDEILQTEFNLSKGLADYSKIEHEIINENYNPKNKGSNATFSKTFHKVQILDPAVGTGTFLAEVINRIYDKFEGMQGMWQGYVREHLLPRLNGFEILMAPYAIAHLKLDWLLNETGYIHDTDKRLKVYLTNSLEEYHPDLGTLFSMWLSNEANEASRIKRDVPVMVVIGNPPYNISGSNKGKWIMDLMKSYKTEPNSIEPIKEKNKKSLNDDYVKFIRMAHYFINKNNEGVLAFINPHGFLENPTFRGMRWELLRTFDAIYTIDLHGNSKKQETTPDGSKDENVFDIMQGVSINFFIKTGKKKDAELGKAFHTDIFGTRKYKYDFLKSHSYLNVDYKELSPQPPMYFLVPKDTTLEQEYNQGFAVNELFPLNSMGIATAFDDFVVGETKEIINERISLLIQESLVDLKRRPIFNNTPTSWIEKAKKDIGPVLKEELIKSITYRPFDTKWVYYTGKSNGLMDRPRSKVAKHLLFDNISLCAIRVNRDNANTIFVAKGLIDKTLLSSKDNVSFFPLFVYSEDGEIKIPNLEPNIIIRIKNKINSNILPIEIIDYVYGILNSPKYQKKYREFLKTDFPRVPYPKYSEDFYRYMNIGRELRKLHTMENSASWEVKTTYPVSGSNVVEFIKYEKGKIRINDNQYFGNVPEIVWNFYIGGYQPAQKWLKDRKGKTMSFSDIRHYQEIIYILIGTAEIIERKT